MTYRANTHFLLYALWEELNKLVRLLSQEIIVTITCCESLTWSTESRLISWPLLVLYGGQLQLTQLRSCRIFGQIYEQLWRHHTQCSRALQVPTHKHGRSGSNSHKTNTNTQVQFYDPKHLQDIRNTEVSQAGEKKKKE